MERLHKGEIETKELLEMEYIPREVIDYLRRENCLQITAPKLNGSCSAPELTNRMTKAMSINENKNSNDDV